MNKNTILTIITMGILSMSIGVAHADKGTNKGNVAHTHGERSHSHAGPINHAHNNGIASSSNIDAATNHSHETQVVYVEPIYYPSYAFSYGNRYHRGFKRSYRSFNRNHRRLNRSHRGFNKKHRSSNKSHRLIRSKKR